MRPYYDIPELRSLYLEDSFVLEIDERDGGIAFTVEAVLTEDHPRYHEPKPGEQYCYERIVLAFVNVSSVQWLERSEHVFTDVDGEQDLGNIDVLRWDGELYDIAGDWGHVQVHSAAPPDVRYAPS
jgi:hypothetical protein